jgi:hypothetical protein
MYKGKYSAVIGWKIRILCTGSRSLTLNLQVMVFYQPIKGICLPLYIKTRKKTTVRECEVDPPQEKDARWTGLLERSRPHSILLSVKTPRTAPLPLTPVLYEERTMEVGLVDALCDYSRPVFLFGACAPRAPRTKPESNPTIQASSIFWLF